MSNDYTPEQVAELDESRVEIERATTIDWLRDRPENVADALDRIVRIDTFRGWLSDVRDRIAKGYLVEQAEATEAATGASFRAPVTGLGLVYRTDPQPKPRISDREEFARWYIGRFLDDYPDRGLDHEHGTDGEIVYPEPVVEFDSRVMRRTVATAPSPALLAFVHRVASAEAHAGDATELEGTYAVAVGDLVSEISVDVEWIVAEDTLADLLSGAAHKTNGKPAVALRGGAVVDVSTGEVVPGTDVAPAGDKILTVKADGKVKAAVREELDAILGPAELR